MTDITKQAKKIFDTYLKSVKDSESKLADLEKRVQEFQTVLGSREATKDEIRAAEKRIASLESEREGLKGDYAESLFNADTSEQQRIFRRRNQIDSEIKECRETIRNLRTRLDEHPIDSKQAATLKVEIDSFKEPYALGMVNELRDMLKRDSEISQRHHELRMNFPEVVDKETYHELRMELDGSYASEHRAIEKQAAAHKKQQERAAKYVNPFSTPPKVDARVTTKYVEN